MLFLKMAAAIPPLLLHSGKLVAQGLLPESFPFGKQQIAVSFPRQSVDGRLIAALSYFFFSSAPSYLQLRSTQGRRQCGRCRRLVRCCCSRR